MSDELVVPTAVCISHMRFIPCRKGPKGCNIKTENKWIELVRRYQDSVLGSND